MLLALTPNTSPLFSQHWLFTVRHSRRRLPKSPPAVLGHQLEAFVAHVASSWPYDRPWSPTTPQVLHLETRDIPPLSKLTAHAELQPVTEALARTPDARPAARAMAP